MTTTIEPTARLPKHCPGWCTKNHRADLADGATIEQAAEHLAGGPSGQLSEIRNSVDGRIMREGGGSWDLCITQQEFVKGPRGSYVNAATANLQVTIRVDGVWRNAVLHLTSSESRSLAAGLIHAADRLEFR